MCGIGNRKGADLLPCVRGLDAYLRQQVGHVQARTHGGIADDEGDDGKGDRGDEVGGAVLGQQLLRLVRPAGGPLRGLGGEDLGQVEVDRGAGGGAVEAGEGGRGNHARWHGGQWRVRVGRAGLHAAAGSRSCLHARKSTHYPMSKVHALPHVDFPGSTHLEEAGLQAILEGGGLGVSRCCCCCLGFSFLQADSVLVRCHSQPPPSADPSSCCPHRPTSSV